MSRYWNSSVLALFLFYMIASFTPISYFFFFNDTATTEIYTLSLHDALPIWSQCPSIRTSASAFVLSHSAFASRIKTNRSEEHTSELQSRLHLVCRLLLEKKKTNPATLAARTPLPLPPHTRASDRRPRRHPAP